MGRKINPILLAILAITIIGAIVWWQNGGKSQVPISYYVYIIRNEIQKEIGNIFNDFSVSRLAVKNPIATPQSKNSIYAQIQVLDVFYKGKTATSQYTKQVLDYLDYLKFPASLRRGLIIVIASPDFTSQVFYFDNKELPFKKPTDTYPASITQICYGSNCLNLVAMKSDYFPSNFYATLAHELGHAIGESLTAEDWQKWKTCEVILFLLPSEFLTKNGRLRNFKILPKFIKLFWAIIRGTTGKTKLCMVKNHAPIFILSA